MSIHLLFINLFPDVARLLRISLFPVGVVVVAVMVASGWDVALKAWRRRRIRKDGRGLGLSPTAARFAARILQREIGLVASEALHTPELLAELLGQHLEATQRPETAARFAQSAAKLMDELHWRQPAFEGAPRLFDSLAFVDPTDPDSPSITGWVSRIDERNLAVVTGLPCPWPVRQSVVVTPNDNSIFEAMVLLRPMPGAREWVLTHDLAAGLENRRTHHRVEITIETWSLDPTAQIEGLRDRLRRGDRVPLGRLRRTPAWPSRHNITVADLSVDGALLSLDHEVRRRERFHMAIPAEGLWPGERPADSDEIAVLPLAEVVSVRGGKGGRLAVGVRFCAMRLRERSALRDIVRRAAARNRQTAAPLDAPQDD